MAKMTETIRGLMDSIFGKKHIMRPDVDGLFKVLTGYTPAFTTWGGEIYESELIRAVVDAKARHCSKLVVDVQGTAKPKLRAALRPGPNPWQTWSQFLYRLCTILEVQNNAWIVPVLDEDEKPVGIFPVLPDKVTLLDVDGEVWVEYQFQNGQTGYMEMKHCRWMTKFQYRDDFFGTGNRALSSTMELIHLQEQGISEGIKNSATFRFMAQLKNFMDPRTSGKSAGDLTRRTCRERAAASC